MKEKRQDGLIRTTFAIELRPRAVPVTRVQFFSNFIFNSFQLNLQNILGVIHHFIK